VRVYLGSFWNGALINDDFERMFEKDEKLLVQELVDLPRCAAERKVNQMVNRIRLVKVHVCLLGTLSKMTPRLFGKKRSRARLLGGLDSIMDNVRVEFDLSKGDMPDPEEFARCLNNFPDFSVFPPTDRDLIEKLDLLIEVDIPNIIREADSVRLGQTVVVRGGEKHKNKSMNQGPIVVEPCDQNQNSLSIRGFLGKVVFFCILAISLAEGVYFLSYSSPASSLIELQGGCINLLNVVLDHPNVSEIRSKVVTVFHDLFPESYDESYDHDVPSPPQTTSPDARSEL
jgi:hypothetical protein